MAESRLTPRQEAFCQHYAANPNATEAALKAGYSKRTARSVGCENLTKPDIKARIKELTSSQTQHRIMGAVERQAWWTEVLQDSTASMKDRLKASELLGKAQGDFVERVNGDLRIRIVDESEPG